MLYDYLNDLVIHFDGKNPDRLLSMIKKALDYSYISEKEYKLLYSLIKAKYYEFKRNDNTNPHSG